MAFARNGTVRLYWRSDGAADRPVLLLLHAIGTDVGVWDRTLPWLLEQFRVLRMDLRGHGASDAPPGDYRMEQLCADVVAVMDAAGVDRAAVCGLSLGGMVALALALRHAARVGALICACTSARMDAAAWSARIGRARTQGMTGIADAAMQRYVSDAFSRNHPELTATVRSTLLATSVDGYTGCGAVVRDTDLLPQLASVSASTLVISGDRDIATPFEGHGARIVEGVPGARHTRLDTAHLPCVEAPADFAAAVGRFVRELTEGPALRAADAALEAAGLATRRQILGDAWVDEALAARTPFNAEFQALITRYAWHGIWDRPGLDSRTRRLLVIAITVALGRWEEFRLHVRSGLQRGGFTEQELKETLLQTAIYAGVPAANTAFAEAAAVIQTLRTAT